MNVKESIYDVFEGAITEHHGRVFSCPVSYSGGPGFKSHPGAQPS
jgi:hypothetical protein